MTSSHIVPVIAVTSGGEGGGVHKRLSRSNLATCSPCMNKSLLIANENTAAAQLFMPKVFTLKRSFQMFRRKLAPFNLSAVIVFYANPKSKLSPTDFSVPKDVKLVLSI